VRPARGLEEIKRIVILSGCTQTKALTAGLQKENERFAKTTPTPPLLLIVGRQHCEVRGAQEIGVSKGNLDGATLSRTDIAVKASSTWHTFEF